LITEMTPAIDHLFGRASGDAELQPSARDQIGGARVLDHVKRVLVPHVDHGGADLDAVSLCSYCREQRKRRGKLAGKMVDAKIGAVRAQLLGGDRKLDGLQ